MEKPPMEWIDNLFNCMEQFYGSRWTKNFSKNLPESLFKTMWQSALTGLTYEQIKRTLVFLKRAAESPTSLPPHQLEFFRYAHSGQQPHIDYEGSARGGNPEVARRAIDEINRKLGRNISLEKAASGQS